MVGEDVREDVCLLVFSDRRRTKEPSDCCWRDLLTGYRVKRRSVARLMMQVCY